MRKVIIALLTCTVLALPLVMAAAASAQTPVYVCDGIGEGICMSLKAGATLAPDENLISLGENAGAWRWIVSTVSYVGEEPGYDFSYGPLENQLEGQPVLVFKLYADDHYCAANSDGGAVINTCNTSLEQAWVLDPTNHYLVNMGRSNDKDNWEVLCNPGIGDKLVIGTRDSCTTYHEEWAIVL